MPLPDSRPGSRHIYRRKTALGTVAAGVLAILSVISLLNLWQSPLWLVPLALIMFAAFTGLYFDGPAASIMITASEVVVANPLKRIRIPVGRVAQWSIDGGPHIFVAGQQEPIQVAAFSINQSIMSVRRYREWQNSRITWAKSVTPAPGGVRHDSGDLAWEWRRGHLLLLAAALVCGIVGLIIAVNA